MLRLWREQITVGLFAGCCWLRRRSSKLATSSSEDLAALATAFDSLLAQAAPLHGAWLDLIVSDRAARIAALPWHPKLRSRSDWEAYAQAAFEAGAMSLDDGWVCVPAMRRYGEQGLALALPIAWLAVLEETARRHGARLRTVMPLSAAAYWSPRRWMGGSASSWLLLEEKNHATLLSFDGRSSIAYDTQPTVDKSGLSQLLRRCLLAGTPSKVAVWRLEDTQQSHALEAVAPDAKVQLLPQDYWDRHA